MSRPNVTNYNAETNETEVREMNDAEFTQWELDCAEEKANKKAVSQKEKARLELLERLGITADEAALLLGWNPGLVNPLKL